LRYTERQQHCLESMGLVAWVSRDDEYSDATADVLAGSALDTNTSAAIRTSVSTSVDDPAGNAASASSAAAANANVSSSAGSYASTATAVNLTDNFSVSSSVNPSASTPANPTVAPGSSYTEWVEPPKDVTELAAWLPAQMLSPVSSAAQSLFYAGIETAPLLIIEEADISNQLAGPVGMSADGAKLFNLMMRAINVATACVQEMIYSETRAVLYLSRRWDSINHCSTHEHHCRLVQSLLPAWRVPHPDILLQRSDYKRQAWHCLQGLQSALAR